jgi:hypothetical protein
MAAVLILLSSGDCVADMEMSKFREEMNADYSKIVTPVSRGRFRRVDQNSLDKNRRQFREISLRQEEALYFVLLYSTVQ